MPDLIAQKHTCTSTARHGVAGHMPGVMSGLAHQHPSGLPRQDACMKPELYQGGETLLPGEKDLLQVFSSHPKHGTQELYHETISSIGVIAPPEGRTLHFRQGYTLP